MFHQYESVQNYIDCDKILQHWKWKWAAKVDINDPSCMRAKGTHHNSYGYQKPHCSTVYVYIATYCMYQPMLLVSLLITVE